MKKAELDAMAALLNASTINIQRVYRGFAARLIAKEARREMAEFINAMRTQDAMEDEEDYYNAHPAEKLGKELKETFRDIIGDLTGSKKKLKEKQDKLDRDEGFADEEDDDSLEV